MITLGDIKQKVLSNTNPTKYQTWFPEAIKEFYENNKGAKLNVISMEFYKLRNSRTKPETDGVVMLNCNGTDVLYYITIIGDEFWFHYTEDPYTKYVVKKEVTYTKF